jgi:hypothetical protein
MNFLTLIESKRNGGALSVGEIQQSIHEFTTGGIRH